MTTMALPGVALGDAVESLRQLLATAFGEQQYVIFPKKQRIGIKHPHHDAYYVYEFDGFVRALLRQSHRLTRQIEGMRKFERLAQMELLQLHPSLQ